MSETRPGRLMMLPAAIVTEVIFLLTARIMLSFARAATSTGMKAGFLYCGVYAGVFVLVYAGLIVWLRVKVGHLVEPDDLKFRGLSLPAFYARTGLRWVDLVGVAASLAIFAVCILKAELLFLAPFPLLAAFGFLGGLVVGSAAPWPLERRGTR